MTALETRTETIVLAGGKGERLSPLTIDRPKPAVSFGGMFRIIDFTLSNCFHSKLDRVSLLTQYRHTELHEYIRRGWSSSWNEKSGRNQLLCLPPAGGKRYRGTADAVFQNLSILQSKKRDFVLILSGDHIYQMDYRDLLQQHADTNADLTVATVEHPLEEASHFGVVQIDNNLRVVGFEEKPQNPKPLPGRQDMALVSMGVYVFKTDVLAQVLLDNCDLGHGYDFGHDIVPALIPAGRVFAYDFHDERRDAPRYWRDIGKIDSYYQASMDLLEDDPPFDPFANEIRPSQPTRHPVSIEESRWNPCVATNTEVVQSIVSAGVRIHGRCQISNSILMPGVIVGEGSELRGVIVEEGTRLPPGFRAGFDLAHDRKHHTVTERDVVVVAKDTSEASHTATRASERHPMARTGLKQLHALSASA